MTDDGGGQVAQPHEGTQLLQFSQRYQEGVGPDRVHFPVYTGLGNHDLDQDGPPPHVDWYRRELRDYVEMNHRPACSSSRRCRPAITTSTSDCYSWDWGGLHLVQTHRFAGDTNKGAVSGSAWLKSDLADNAGDGRPVVLFQHYGWDPFSIERWDPDRGTFDDERQRRAALVERRGPRRRCCEHRGYNVVGIFHGHQHETPMIYSRDGLDIFKPKAAYMGGFALVRVTDRFMDVVLGEAVDEDRRSAFTNAFSKKFQK